jgi:spermidine synthase
MSPLPETTETLVRRDGVDGEVVIRRRPTANGDVYELIVNGAFLMDTAETSTERLLARAVLDRHATPERILVGGLGFGCTVAELLTDSRVRHIDLIEVEPALVDVLREGVVPGVDVVLADSRVRVHVADVRDAVRDCEPASYDGILLDVDNGPGFLTHQANADLYDRPLLTAAAQALRSNGLLAIWSADPAERLATALADVVGPAEIVTQTVRREDRDVTYHIHLARKALATR